MSCYIDLSSIINEIGSSLNVVTGIQIDELCEFEASWTSAHLIIKCHVVNAAEGLFISGEIFCKLKTRCARCLRDTEMDVDIAINEFVETDTSKGFEHYFDIEPLVKEAVVLNLPQKMLCNESCKGLCSCCGNDLNFFECGCNEVQNDGRWDKLLKLNL